MNKEPKKQKGKVIRVSELTYGLLAKKRQSKMSWDALLRRQFGLPDKRGNPQPLGEWYVLPEAMQVFDSLPKAKGAAVLNAVKSKSGRAERPLKVRECV